MVRVERGGVYEADLGGTEGHEQRGPRPVLVLSDARYTARLGLVVAVPLTSKLKWKPPLQVPVGVFRGREGWALPGQIRALDVARLDLEQPYGVVSGAVCDAVLDGVNALCGRLPIVDEMEGGER